MTGPNLFWMFWWGFTAGLWTGAFARWIDHSISRRKSKDRIRTAFDMIQKANTVSILSLDEMEAVVNRALYGEFDD